MSKISEWLMVFFIFNTFSCVSHLTAHILSVIKIGQENNCHEYLFFCHLATMLLLLLHAAPEMSAEQLFAKGKQKTSIDRVCKFIGLF
jgi:hypothetical protein